MYLTDICAKILMIIFNIITGTVTPSSLFKDSQTKILFNDKH